MKGFRDLKVWEKAHQCTLQVYKASTSFPREEMYGLTSQIRRAAASIPANIAEGCGRNSDAELGRLLQIAMDSASEPEYHLLLTRDLSLLAEEEHSQLAHEVCEVKRMLASFIQKLNADR